MCKAATETLDKPTQRQACSGSELRLPIRRLSSRYYTLCTVHYTLVHSCTESSAALLHRCCGSKRDPSHMSQCPFQANPNNSWQQHTMRYPLVSSKLLDHDLVKPLVTWQTPMTLETFNCSCSDGLPGSRDKVPANKMN